MLMSISVYASARSDLDSGHWPSAQMALVALQSCECAFFRELSVGCYSSGRILIW